MLKKGLQHFKEDELHLVNEAVSVAEEVTSNAYKMSFSEWRHRRYDIKTLADLAPEEIVQGPFAQIIRYIGRKPETSLGSSTYDFYKICLQDDRILTTLKAYQGLHLFPFTVYMVTHELVHVIRFTEFLQAFETSLREKTEEEARVHEKTRTVLTPAPIDGMEAVFEFFEAWQEPLDCVKNM